MLFEVQCLVNDTNKNYYIDNIDMSMYDDSLNTIYSKSQPTKSIGYFDPNKNPNNFKDNLNDLLIFAGSKCNYRCDYCPEIPFRTSALDPTPTSIEQFKVDVASNINLKNIKTIAISGGEPLVYWKHLKSVVSFLRDNCPNLINFRMATNGDLLTDEIVQYCIKEKLRLLVSDDGGNNCTRHLRSNQQTLQQYAKYNDWASLMNKDFIIRYQLGSHHLDAVEMYNYFKSSIPNLARIADHGTIETVVPSHKFNQTEKTIQFYASKLTDDQFRLVSDSRLKMLTSNYVECGKTAEILNNFINQVENRRYYAPQFTCPQPYGNTVKLTLSAKVLDCIWVHTNNNIICDISQINQAIVKGRYKSWEIRDECYKCPFVGMCRGICAKATNESVRHSCKLKYADKLAYFKAFMKIKFNAEVLSIAPVDDTCIEAAKAFNGYLSNYSAIKQKVNWKFNDGFD